MARQTEYKYIRGILFWVRTKQVNPWGKWSCQIYPNGEGLEIIRELQSEGLKNALKKDDDGYFATFSRPSEKTDRMGRKYGLAPVEVIGPDGSKYEGLVGNGSKGTIKLEVYKHKTPGGGEAKAARLMAMKIDDLVPFEPNRDMTEREAEAVEGLADQFKKPAYQF